MPGDREQEKAEKTALKKATADPQKSLQKTFGVGIHYDIQPDVYHSDPCERPSLSCSIACLLISQSPAHANIFHPKLGGLRKSASAGMNKGTLLHALMLEPHLVDSKFVVVDEKDWRKKTAQQARDKAEAEGKVPMLKHQFEKAKDLADRLRGKFFKLGYDVREYKKEATIIWEEEADDGTQVLCRGRVDLLNAPLILDLKSTISANPDDIAKSFVNFGYDIQWAAYTSAIARLQPELAGRAEMDFLFFETEPPYAVTPCEPDGPMSEMGESKWRRAINMWSHCVRTKQWREYLEPGQKKARIAAPMWALRRELGVEVEP